MFLLCKQLLSLLPLITCNRELIICSRRPAEEQQRIAPTETLNAAFVRALTATADEAVVEDQITHEILQVRLNS